MKKSNRLMAVISTALVAAACNPVTTVPQLKELQQNAIMYAIIVAIAAFALSFLVATLIPYQGGKDKSYVTRRIFFIVIGVIAGIGYFLFNKLVVADCIKNQGFVSQYGTTTIIGTAIVVGIFVILGLLVALLFRRSKFATVFLKPKKK